MRTAPPHPVFSMTGKIKKAAQTGKPVRFTTAEVEILLRDEIYLAITRLEAEVMRNECARDPDNDNSLGIIGSGNAPTAAPGASAGSSAGATDVMSLGARQRLSEAMSEVALRKKQ